MFFVEKHRYFEMKRKEHYRMKESLRRAKELLLSEESASDEDPDQEH